LFLPLWTRAKVRAPTGAAVTVLWLVGAFTGALAWGVHARAEVDRTRPISYANAAKAGYDAAARRTAPNPEAVTSAPARRDQTGRDLDCLAAAVYYEARGESAQGQAAVAQVVLNRIRHPAYPKSVCAVVYQGVSGHGCQFSFVCNGAMRAAREPIEWAHARDVATRALGGYVMARVGQATQFHTTRLGPGGRAAVLVGRQVFFEAGGDLVPVSTVTASLAAPATSLSQGS